MTDADRASLLALCDNIVAESAARSGTAEISRLQAENARLHGLLVKETAHCITLIKQQERYWPRLVAAEAHLAAVEQERDDHYASGLALADELHKAKALLGRWVSFGFCRIGANWCDMDLVEHTHAFIKPRRALK